MGFLQARVLQWVAVSFSRGSFLPRDGTWVSCIASLVAQTVSRSVVSDSEQPRRRGGQTRPGHRRSGHHERPSWGPEPPAAGGADPGEELGRGEAWAGAEQPPGHSRERGPWRVGVQSFGSSAQVVQGAGHPPGPGAPLSGPLCDSVLLSTSAGACPLRKVEEGGPAFCTEADLGRQPPRSPAQIATFICLVSLCGFLNPQAASLLPVVNVLDRKSVV